MKITGIICEYNPLHLGHYKQIKLCKAEKDTALVCLMSGNFVQRGAPAVIDRMARAKAAVLCGADLVLELPVTGSLSSAEGFAKTGVDILAPICDSLCFGAETDDGALIMNTAKLLLSEEFSGALRVHLDQGLSFPAARQKALEQLGADSKILETPNNILAVEYCKAILQSEHKMLPMPIKREGSYHDQLPDRENPSATAVRTMMAQGADWEDLVPQAECFRNAKLHQLAWGEKAVLAKLRTMTDAEFEALPYGSEGLWRKLMHNARSQATLEDILTQTKSKRYTRTRLDRMVMCAFLGITGEILASPSPYTRILAFNDIGREILKQARNLGNYVNLGERMDDPWQTLEDRCGDLYGLFAKEPEAPGRSNRDRVYYHKD